MYPGGQSAWEVLPEVDNEGALHDNEGALHAEDVLSVILQQSIASKLVYGKGGPHPAPDLYPRAEPISPQHSQQGAISLWGRQIRGVVPYRTRVAAGKWRAAGARASIVRRYSDVSGRGKSAGLVKGGLEILQFLNIDDCKTSPGALGASQTQAGRSVRVKAGSWFTRQSGGLGLSPSQQMQTIQFLPPSIMAERESECTVCMEKFGTRESLLEHTWAFQTEIATLLARLQTVVVHNPEHKCVKTPVDVKESQVECTVCWARFVTHEKAREHTWAFQTKITTLLARLQSLLVHRWPEREHNESQDLTNGTDDEHDNSEEGESSSMIQKRCPDKDCTKSTTIFGRQQEFTRHYGTHFECIETCRYCLVTFTRPSKFWGHIPCAQGSPRQKQYVKMRGDALRKLTRKALNAAMRRKKRASDVLKVAASSEPAGGIVAAPAAIYPSPANGLAGQTEAFPGRTLVQSTSGTPLRGPGSGRTIASLGIDIAPLAYQQHQQAPVWQSESCNSNQLDGGIATSTPLWPVQANSAGDPTVFCGQYLNFGTH
ncbi:hypothetical protein EDB81DRAFT_768355 [Dactylonectria macrodidyma]|uniref:Uncharacterized protein n=1 Tax=Dactylonectria macrodidyma TaxID=307937 RepID=A0A9P9D4S3_9HYPO|nr:hypothetical protein EDB81DRAFT_768355 [Dactylonectria macrodidyma]